MVANGSLGGLHLALARSGVDAEVLQAFDWDQTACQVYKANHGDIVRKVGTLLLKISNSHYAKQVDISTLAASSLSEYKADLWLLSPACQPYTVLNPDAKGAQDPRAQSFLHLIQNVLPEMAILNKHPERLLVENVAGFEVCPSSFRQFLSQSEQHLSLQAPGKFCYPRFIQSATLLWNCSLLPCNSIFPIPAFDTTCLRRSCHCRSTLCRNNQKTERTKYGAIFPVMAQIGLIQDKAMQRRIMVWPRRQFDL